MEICRLSVRNRSICTRASFVAMLSVAAAASWCSSAHAQYNSNGFEPPTFPVAPATGIFLPYNDSWYTTTGASDFSLYNKVGNNLNGSSDLRVNAQGGNQFAFASPPTGVFARGQRTGCAIGDVGPVYRD